MSRRIPRALLSVILLALCSCGGGGGGGSAMIPSGPIAAPAPTPVPAPSAPPVSSASGTVTPNGPSTVTLPPAAGGISGSIVLTPSSTTATIALTLAATPPSGTLSLQGDRRVVQTIGAAATALAYLTAQSSANVTFASTFGVSIATPGTVTGNEYLVMFDPANPSAGWNLVSEPGTGAAGIAPGFGNIVLSLTKGVTYVFALITAQSALTLPSPSPTPSQNPVPTPTPTATPVPTSSPTPSPTPAPVVVSVSSLQFLGVGPAYAATIAVTQAGYNGFFTLSGTSCNGIVSADQLISSQNFTITPLATGTCSYAITGGGGAHTTLPITVTTVIVVGT